MKSSVELLFLFPLMSDLHALYLFADQMFDDFELALLFVSYFLQREEAVLLPIHLHLIELEIKLNKSLFHYFSSGK